MKVEIEGLKTVHEAFDAAPKVVAVSLLRALRRGTRSARTYANREVSKDIGLKVSEVRKRIKVREPTMKLLEGALQAPLSRVPLIKFNARGPYPSRGRGRGVSYKGKGGRKRIRKAFMARWKGSMRVFARAGDERTPLHELTGPSVGLVMAKHARPIQRRGFEVFRTEFERLMNRAGIPVPRSTGAGFTRA